MEDKKSSIIYECICCDYNTSRKSQWNRHLTTAKHLRLTLEDNLVPQHSLICNCGSEYKCRQGLWKHKKNCNYKESSKSSESSGNFNSDNENSEIKILTNLVKDVIKQNQELTNKIVDICSKPNSISNTNVHSNNNNNKTFNINFFLNETCKDAMNINDFVSSIKVNLEELENTGRQGYIEGISNIILKRLNNLEQAFRPLHCSDSKREVFYIKDNNEWKKENEEKPILTKAIKIIANENIKQIKHWRDKYPDCTDADSKKNNLYLKIVSNSMNGSTQEEGCKNIDKIISNVAKEVIIDKTNF